MKTLFWTIVFAVGFIFLLAFAQEQYIKYQYPPIYASLERIESWQPSDGCVDLGAMWHKLRLQVTEAELPEVAIYKQRRLVQQACSEWLDEQHVLLAIADNPSLLAEYHQIEQWYKKEDCLALVPAVKAFKTAFTGAGGEGLLQSLELMHQECQERYAIAIWKSSNSDLAKDWLLLKENKQGCVEQYPAADRLLEAHPPLVKIRVLATEVKTECRSEYLAYQFEKQYRRFLTVYDRLKRYVDRSQCKNAFPLVDEAFAIIEQDKLDNKDYIADVYRLKAWCHFNNWQYFEAKEAYAKAYEMQGRHDDARQIRQIDLTIAEQEKERDDEDTYYVMKDVGPAKTLIGKVVTAMVYLETAQYEWSNLARQQASHALVLSQQWYQARASEYGIEPPSFINRDFILSKKARDPMWDQWLEMSFVGKSSELPTKMANAIAVRLGHASVNSMLEKLKKEEKANQAQLYIAVNTQKRSFASPCFNDTISTYKMGSRVVREEKSSSCSAEYAFILNRAKDTRWQSMHYALAHEGLHVFGASDLYNISKAKEYAVNDIMHYPVRYLEYSHLESLTAYAIGWRKSRPATPFPVEDIGN